MRASLRSPLLITASISCRDQPGDSINSQLTSSRTFCTRTQPDEWKRRSSPNRFFSGVSCMYTPSLLGKLMRIEPRGGVVAQHIARPEIAALAAQRDRMSARWGEPHLRRHVQRLQCLILHHAIGRQTVPGLEALDRRLDIGVVDVGHAGIGVEIA